MTGPWTVIRSYGVAGPNDERLWCHDALQQQSRAVARYVADALNWAWAAPDLTALRTIVREELAIAEQFGVANVGSETIADRVVDRVAALIREDTDQ